MEVLTLTNTWSGTTRSIRFEVWQVGTSNQISWGVFADWAPNLTTKVRYTAIINGVVVDSWSYEQLNGGSQGDSSYYFRQGTVTGNYGANSIQFYGNVMYNNDNLSQTRTLTLGYPAPSSVTVSATDITRAGATLKSTYNTSGASVTKVVWSWKKSSASEWETKESTSYADCVLTDLTSNTVYDYKISVTTSGGTTTSSTSTFTTLHNAPVIGTSQYTHVRKGDYYETTISYTPTHDNTSPSILWLDLTLEDGSTERYVGYWANNTVTFSITDQGLLRPNTVYSYTITHKDNGLANTTTSTVTRSFRTPCLLPQNITTNFIQNNPTGIVLKVNTTGDENAPITQQYLYYRKSGATTSSSINIGNLTIVTLSGLDIDTNYDIWLVAYNYGGSAQGAIATYSTALSNPVINDIVYLDIQPFSCTIQVDASITPDRGLGYSYSLDGGNNWTTQNRDTITLTNLAEETTYELRCRVSGVPQGINAIPTVSNTMISTFTTPADQARAYIKTDGEWKKSKMFIKDNGEWRKIKKMYIKKDGQWVRINN